MKRLSAQLAALFLIVAFAAGYNALKARVDLTPTNGAKQPVPNWLRWLVPDPDKPVLDTVQSLLEKHYLDTPRTADWLERRIVARSGNYLQVYVQLDAQNQFGATMRRNLCLVAIREDNQVKIANGLLGISEHCDPDNEQILRIYRTAAKWPNQ